MSYDFHGIGCCVEFDKIVVDFDAGPNGRIDGFDAWRLIQFAECFPIYAEFADYHSLNAELRELLASGELINFPDTGSDLFFFPDGPE